MEHSGSKEGCQFALRWVSRGFSFPGTTFNLKMFLKISGHVLFINLLYRQSYMFRSGLVYLLGFPWNWFTPGRPISVCSSASAGQQWVWVQPASQPCLPIPSSSSCSLSHRWKTFCSKTPQHKLSQTHTSLFLFALIKTNLGKYSPSKCKILLYLRPPPYPAPAPTLHVQHQQLLARQGSSPTAPSAPSAR